MNAASERTTTIQKASWIALCGNTILAAAKIIVGMISGSLSVLSDGLDSATDVLIAALTLFAAKISSKPGDPEHPYGHGRAETVSTALISLVIFFAGGQIFISALKGIFGSRAPALPSALALWVTLLSIGGKLFLAWSQFHFGKKSGSSMLIANGKNMRGDVVTSAAVLLGLILTFLTGVPVLDKIFAALVSLWILRNAVGIFLEANTELMDGTKDRGIYEELFSAIAKIPEAGNPHRVRLRRLGSFYVVDLDIEVEPEMSVRRSHLIAVSVEKAIKVSLPDIYDVIVHVEPKGNIEEEKFGLSSKHTD
ncbi:MAG: cation diffusion facilitator family transporter [Spirochaetes bacterium]|nr:cation diffusion facilitator family transporter [Spirochaetota bacterium]